MPFNGIEMNFHTPQIVSWCLVILNFMVQVSKYRHKMYWVTAKKAFHFVGGIPYSEYILMYYNYFYEVKCFK